MHDSFGDSWNGNFLYIVNANGDTLNTGGSTVSAGSEEDDSLCIDNGCYWVTVDYGACLLYTSPSPRDATLSRMPSSA